MTLTEYSHLNNTFMVHTFWKVSELITLVKGNFVDDQGKMTFHFHQVQILQTSFIMFVLSPRLHTLTSVTT